jgi:hypothetical protein
MIPLFFYLLLIICLPSANADWVMCHPQASCENLIIQPGSYSTPEDCGAKCRSIGEAYKYFTYTPGTLRCSCSATCDSATPDSNVNSYCLDLDYFECWPGNYCKDPSLVVQVGTYSTPQLCADQCWNSNSENTLFNLQTISQQCMCLTKCSQLIPAENVSVYSINNSPCTTEATGNLRRSKIRHS